MILGTPGIDTEHVQIYCQPRRKTGTLPFGKSFRKQKTPVSCRLWTGHTGVISVEPIGSRSASDCHEGFAFLLVFGFCFDLLDDAFIARRLSPGGSADLLALVFLMDHLRASGYVTKEEEYA